MEWRIFKTGCKCRLKCCYYALTLVACVALWHSISVVRDLTTKKPQRWVPAKVYDHFEKQPVRKLTTVEPNGRKHANVTRLRHNTFKKGVSSYTAYEKYYSLNRPRKNHCNFAFIVNGSRICEGIRPFVVILIPSAPLRTEERMTIRETWGNVSKHNLISRSQESNVLALVFLIGRGMNISVDKTIVSESEQFKDIVIGDFKDSYSNLTRKILMGLNWMNIYCANAEYLFKVDDDIFVHIPRLINFLRNIPDRSPGALYGYLYSGGPVLREGRWAVPIDGYPMSNYPPYMSGNAYVISGNIAGKLLNASQYMPYLPIEDAFITGVLPKVIDAKLVTSRQFSYFGEDMIKPCIFMKRTKITCNRVNVSQMRTLWSVQQTYPTSCRR